MSEHRLARTRESYDNPDDPWWVKPVFSSTPFLDELNRLTMHEIYRDVATRSATDHEILFPFLMERKCGR